MDGTLGAHQTRSGPLYPRDGRRKRLPSVFTTRFTADGCDVALELTQRRATTSGHKWSSSCPQLNLPALCCDTTRKSIGPASIAPFLAGLGRPPALPGSSFVGPVPLRRRGPRHIWLARQLARAGGAGITTWPP